MSSAAVAAAARVAALRARLADLGLSPDDEEVEALAAMEGMFHASLRGLRASAGGEIGEPADGAPVD
jgi:hypothetical protein